MLPTLPQTKKASLAEALLMTFGGFWLTFLTQYILYWTLSIQVSITQSAVRSIVVTLVHFCFYYGVRRLFNFLRARGLFV